MTNISKDDIYVSYYSGRPQKNGGYVSSVRLWDVMNRCLDIDENAEKGATGGIFPYISRKNKQGMDFYPSNILFIDVDHISDEYVDGVCVTDIILNNFDKLCSLLPNIVTAYTSKRYNIHFILYQKDIKDGDDYIKYNQIYSAVISRLIYKVCDIDLRLIKDSVDTHNQIMEQRFFLNHTNKLYWNSCIQNTNIKNDDIKKLKIEYPNLFIKERGQMSERNVNSDTLNKIININYLTNDGTKITVDQNYIIRGFSGYNARTRICSTVFHHFNGDLDKTVGFLQEHFNFNKEFVNQFRTLVNNNNTHKFYNVGIEEDLFGKENCQNRIELKQNEYIPDRLGLGDILGGMTYIC